MQEIIKNQLELTSVPRSQPLGQYVDNSVQVTLTNVPAPPHEETIMSEKVESNKVISVSEKIISIEQELESDAKTESIHAENVIMSDMVKSASIKSEMINDDYE
jgi:hypothetical protein